MTGGRTFVAGCLVLLAGCVSVPPLSRVAAAGNDAAIELAETPFFPQQEHQCGPAALATVLVASGVEVTPDDLVPQVLLPERKGSLQVELVGATRRHGRVPYVLPQDPSALLAEVRAGHPVVVLQNLALPAAPRWHYAVVVGYDAGRQRAVLRSGTVGRLEQRWSRFYQSWDYAGRWAMVALRPGELPVIDDVSGFLAAVAGVEATGQLDVAASSYGAAARRWPDQPLTWFGAGNVAYRQGDLLAAARDFRQAAALAPDDPAALNNLAQVLAELGCAEAAEESALRAVTVANGTLLDISRRTLQALPMLANANACPAEFGVPRS